MTATDIRALTDPAIVRRSPEATAAALRQAGLYGLDDIEVRHRSAVLVVFWLVMRPWLATAAEGYPVERVSLCVWDDDTVSAISHSAAGRNWMHRNLDAILEKIPDAPRGAWGTLCLWYPGDPRGLTWEWSDGLDQYVTIVHRHLQAEEFARRNGCWPAEDAPHGAGIHPLRTAATRAAAEEWRPAC